MNNRNSLNGRLSLSTSNLSGPIAESTHIGGLQQKFPWGGIHSPVKSVENLNHSRNLNDNTKKSFNSSFQKLDPRVYTDVQSQGLTSRIVKYYENSMKLNRSSSFNNLYNKPGQFPVVHLKKNEIPYKFSRNKNNVSIVRIAPPDKSVFQANSRSSILRTGSMIPTISLGLKQSETDISRENRPILHPAVDNETAPTRSVLEALKEISRKRINSDELDCNDSIKKYCKEPNSELTSNLTGPLASLTTHQSSLNSNNLYIKSGTKRHRELTSPSVSPTAKIPNNRQSNNNIVKPRKINNEFTSSISSSLSLLTSKRKYSEQNLSRTPTPVSNETSPSNGQPKQKQRCDIVNSILVSNNLKPDDSINQTVTVKSSLSEGTANNAYNTKKVIEPLRTASEPIIKINSYSGDTANQKPKLTLFNKKYEVSEAANTASVQSDDDSDEIPKISFIKPKNDQANNGITFIKNAMIEKTQKTKLALMLSGLRGDLNEDQDEIDSNTDNNKLQINENSKIEKDDKSKPYFMTSNSKGDNITDKNNKTIKNKNETVSFDKIKTTEQGKQIGGFKFPLEIITNQQEKSNDLTKSASSEINTIKPTSNISTTSTFNPATTQTSTIVFDKNVAQNTITVSADKKNVQDSFASTATSVSGASNSVSVNFKTFNPPESASIQTSMKNQNDINILKPGTTNFNSKIGFDSNFGINKQDKLDSKAASNILNNSISGYTNKNNINGDDIINKQNNQTNVSKPGGFAFGNKLSTLESNSTLFQFSKTNQVKDANSESASTNFSSQTTKTDFPFSTANKTQIVNENAQNPGSLNQSNSTFTFGNNQVQDNSNIFTAPQQSVQTNSAFSFTTSTNKPAPVFPFGNVTSNVNNELNSNQSMTTVGGNLNVNGQTNQAANNQPANTFTSKDPIKSDKFQPNIPNSINQNNLFQFGGPKTSPQNSFTFKSQDNSKEKTNSVFGSNSFNQPAVNVPNNTFLFGGNTVNNTVTSPSKNVFGNNTSNTMSSQNAISDKTTPIFGSTSDTPLLKAGATFNVNNNNNINLNSNTNLNSNNVFSFGNSNTQSNQQLNVNNNSTANFAFGGNNSSINTFGNNKTDSKSNTFGNTASNTTSNIFGSNISNNTLNSFSGNTQNATLNTFGNNPTNSFKTNDNQNTNVFVTNTTSNNSSDKFTFGSTTNSVNNNTVNKNNTAFSFGGSNNIANASSSNVFSFGVNNSGPTTAVDNKSAAFNFTGNIGTNNKIFGATGNSNGNPNNLYNPNAPTDRPIRRATRRLNK